LAIPAEAERPPFGRTPRQEDSERELGREKEQERRLESYHGFRPETKDRRTTELGLDHDHSQRQTT